MTLKKTPALLFAAAVSALLAGCAGFRPAGPRTCVDFEPPLAVGTQYGAPVGTIPGTVVFTTNNVLVSVDFFKSLAVPPQVPPVFNVAYVDNTPVPFGAGQSIRTNNIDLLFDFSQLSFVPSRVDFTFLDLGGYENLSINGVPVFAGELSAVPSPIGRASLAVAAVPVPGGKRGTAILRGPVITVKVGGQEFWIDQVCAQ